MIDSKRLSQNSGTGVPPASHRLWRRCHKALQLGTRGSALARRQAEHVASLPRGDPGGHGGSSMSLSPQLLVRESLLAPPSASMEDRP